LKVRLKERAERLSRFPNAGQETDRPGIRALVDSRHPYLIFYTVQKDEVVNVRHAARQRP
jgi:plasmid stabilization system protein ParE